jgi:hypothetical protein
MNPNVDDLNEIITVIKPWIRQDKALRGRLYRELKKEIGKEHDKRRVAIGRVEAMAELSRMVDEQLTKEMRKARELGIPIREIAGVARLSKDHVHRRTTDG